MAFIFHTEISKKPLEGTLKQEQWAKQIRRQKCEQLQNLGAAGLAKLIRPVIHENDFSLMGCLTMEHCGQLVTAVALHALSNPSAKWWIDKREESATEWLQQSYQPVLKHFIETKPFE